MFKPLLLVALLAGAVSARADTYTTLALPTLNADLRASLGGAAYVPLFPGLHNWTGVPFQLSTNQAGHTSFIDGVLDIPVGVFGVTSAYTLINSAFGVFGANNGSVEFFGTSAYYKVDLIQGQNIRDHLNNVFNNVIDGISAVQAFVDGWARLDQQNYTLPSAFASETLVSMRFTSLNLGNPGGIAFINAATVAVATPVPEPASALLLLGGGAALLAWRRRGDDRPRSSV
ncbi:MAG: PEP-CTERM sorting domain-containing protein [Aquabacterium sp.]